MTIAEPDVAPRSISHRWVGDVVVVLALLFTATLFLDWHRTAVDVLGVMHMHAGSNGWAGWGGVAGVLAITLAAVELKQGRGFSRALPPALGIGLLGSTVAAIAGGTHVSAGSTAIHAGALRWPAFAGLALAALTAAAVIAVYVADSNHAALTTPDHPQGATR